MADLTNLFNGTGKLYQVKPSGSINTFPNTPASATILLEASRSRIIYEAQAVDTFAFTDPVYGSHFYFNDSALAPTGSIVGADEVTDYFIVDTRNDAQQGDIVAGNYDVTRRSRITVIPLVPESGTSDDLISLGGDLLVGDLVILLPKGGGSEYTITIRDKDETGVVGGNFKTPNDAPVVLTGTDDVTLWIKNSDSIKQLAVPNLQALDIANKTLTSGGGSYYCLDTTTPGEARIDTKNGLVILHGNGNTLAANWNVFGEMVNSAKSEGTTLDIILDSPLITDSLGFATLSIFGIQIPDVYCLNYNFVVRAWFDNTDADPVNWEWKAKMLVDQLKEGWIPFFDTGESGVDFLFSTKYPIVSDTSTAIATKSISHLNLSDGLVRFSGEIILADDAPYDDAAGYTLALNMQLPFLANSQTTANALYFMCPVIRPDRSGIYKICTIAMFNTFGALYLYPIPGFDLVTGDIIDVSSISYISGT